jgi:hypothetical protein
LHGLRCFIKTCPYTSKCYFVIKKTHKAYDQGLAKVPSRIVVGFACVASARHVEALNVLITSDVRGTHAKADANNGKSTFRATIFFSNSGPGEGKISAWLSWSFRVKTEYKI